jgi:ribosomal protein S18 acetylase RimI-like enzyme
MEGMARQQVIIRSCTVEDIDAVLSLWREAEATPRMTDTADGLRVAIDDAIVLVADDTGVLVGSAIGGFDGWRGNIYRVVVLPGYRRRGIARALVTEIEDRLIRCGARRITALVETAHPRATAFWEAVGYSLDSRMSRYVRNVDPSKLFPAAAHEDTRR